MLFNDNDNVFHDPLIISGKTIEQVHTTTFLGVIIDDKLSWKMQIDHINTKVCKSIGILRRLQNKLNKCSLLKLYKCFVLPHINYCNIVWGSTYQTSLSKLFTLQKKAIKIVLKVPLKTSTESIFNQSKFNTLAGINKIQTSIFMYKYKNYLLPNSFSDRCLYNSDFRGGN